MTDKFKVGDRVRRIIGSHGRMCNGDEDIVEKIISPTSFVLENYGDGHMPESFELVSKSDMYCSQCNFKSNCSSNCPNCGCNLVYKSSEKIIESKTYKFKVGDKIRMLKDCGTMLIGNIYVVEEDVSGLVVNKPNSSEICFHKEKWQLISNQLNTQEENMGKTKTVYNVLTVNKKTGEVDKDETVVADNESEAILKAYGVPVENLAFDVKERTTFTEEKPQTVVL